MKSFVEEKKFSFKKSRNAARLLTAVKDGGYFFNLFLRFRPNWILQKDVTVLNKK